jgi:hypothetical protein
VRALDHTLGHPAEQHPAVTAGAHHDQVGPHDVGLAHDGLGGDALLDHHRDLPGVPTGDALHSPEQLVDQLAGQGLLPHHRLLHPRG